MRLEFQYGNKNIEYEVVFRKRKTMEIRIEPPDIVKVINPLGVSQEKIMEVIEERGKWIIEKIYHFEQINYRRIKREFVSGESLMYLGKDYSLDVEIDRDIKTPEVKLYRGRFIIRAGNNDKKIIRDSMEKWYRKKAEEVIKEKIKYYQRFFSSTPKEVKIKEQKKRWGSCTHDNKLLFNWRIVMAKSDVLNYIVVHEMCHMCHKDHSKNFWNLVSSILPHYEKSKEWLNNYGFKMDL